MPVVAPRPEASECNLPSLSETVETVEMVSLYFKTMSIKAT